MVGRRRRFRRFLVSPTPIPIMQHSKYTCKSMPLLCCHSGYVHSVAAGRQLIRVAIGDGEMDH